MSTADLHAEQLRMIDSAAAINALLGASQSIVSPRLVTVKVQRPSASFLAECEEIMARKEARRKAQSEAEFEAREDALASAFYDAKELTESDVDDMEHRCEARPYFSRHTNPHEP